MLLCPDEQIFISLVEGSISAEDRQSLHDHMDQCAHCSELVLELARHLIPAELELVSAESLPERYQLMEVIGAGAMGVVHRAWDPMLERPVALKLLRGRGELNEALTQRQLREARHLASLSHPYILPIYDVGIWHGQVFMVTQFVEGGSLARWLNAHEAAPWRELLALFIQAAKGLAAAHAEGIIHRDVKPDNMLVDHKGHLWVADFGLARLQRAQDELPHAQQSSEVLAVSREGAILGTPLYMAPEQHLGCEVDASVDQFGLCVSLFEALYGLLPFTGRSYAQLAHAVCTGQLESIPPERAAKIPQELAQSVRRGLSLSPSERYPSMEALALAWEQLLERAHEPSLARVKTRTNITPLEQPLLGRDALQERLELSLGAEQGGPTLLTLVGVAGVGKTRQALAVAEAQLGQLEVVVFADLRHAQSEAEILSSVAAALGLRFNQQDAASQLVDALCLIDAGLCVLDNAEHLIEPLTRLLARWLEAPGMRWLVTSRRRLGLDAEQVFMVESLELADGLELLKARAGRAWANQDESLLRQLVVALDGLPLAIELAASRARVLSAQQVLDGLDRRFALLRDRKREHDLHRALEAALEHSWELLEPQQRHVLLCATAFVAPFALEDLAALCVAQDHIDQLELVDALDALVEWSLLSARVDEDGLMRFSALMSVQEFARQRHELLDDGSSAGLVARLSARHASRFARQGQQSRRELSYSRAHLPVLKRLMSASADLDRALAWACAHGEVECAVSLAAAIADVCGISGLFEHGQNAVEGVLGLEGVALSDRAWLTERKGRFLRQRSLLQESTACVEQALVWARELDDLSLEGVCLGHLGALASARQETQRAEEHLLQASEISMRAQDKRHAAIWRGQLGIGLRQKGELAQAVECFEFALAQARALGDWRYEIIWSSNLGMVAFVKGHNAEASERFDGALADECTKLDATVYATLWFYRATLLKQRGCFDEALVGFEQAIAQAKKIGFLSLEVNITNNLAGLYFQLGRYHESRASFERTVIISQRIGQPASMINAVINLGAIDELLERYDQARERFEQALTLARQSEQLTYELEAQAQLAMLELHEGRPEAALAALDEVLAVGREHHEGRVLGLWQVGRGYVLGHLGRFDEAREQMEQGCEQLRASNMKLMLTKALCWRGEVEGFAGEVAQVRRYLQEAQALATEVSAPSNSPISLHLNVLRQSLLALIQS